MTFRTFVGIAIAVAFGVYFGLKMFNDPEGFKSDLDALGSLLFLLLLFLVPVASVGLIIYCIWYYSKYGLPYWAEKAGNIVGVIVGIVCWGLILGAIIYNIVQKIKKGGGIKGWWKSHKPKKETVKTTSKGCLKYTGIIILGTVCLLGLLVLFIWAVSNS